MKTWILILLTALAAVTLAQQNCARGACYPPMVDLLVGREQQLSASSTCGLNGIEVFCAPFNQSLAFSLSSSTLTTDSPWKMKCCPCDSRDPAGRNAHTIQNVLSSAGPDRWWQSKKDVNPVTLQFDLKHLYQVDSVMLSFKGPRPDALVIERTADFGRTWQPVLYMAADCSKTYPRISAVMPRDLSDTYCYSLPSTSPNPFQDQRIFFHPLRQFSDINYPEQYKIEALSGYTGLRVNLTQLGEVPRLPGRHPSHFYAIKEMKVMGTCFCHGHADRCLPKITSNYLPSTQVKSVCECKHNTAGVNCERCADLYNDLPWKPAELNYPNACQRCECHNHAQRCRFDPQLFELSGRRSGGVCEDCQHHTTGSHCEQCAQKYYRNPHSNMQTPDACLRCTCNAAGSIHDVCDPMTGQCVCKPNMVGRSCDRCAEGFWKATSSSGCVPCNCDPTRSVSKICDQETGQCLCRSGYRGRTCGGCPENTYGDPLTGCKPCQCDQMGTVTDSCDKDTGMCRCKPGITGPQCDTCARGHCSGFPQCPACPACFFTLDTQLQNLTLWVKQLGSTSPSSPSAGIPGSLARRIFELEITLGQIKELLKLPPPSEKLLDSYMGEINRLWSKFLAQSESLSPADPAPDLEGELDELQRLFSTLQLLYKTKENGPTGPNLDYNGILNALRRAYNKSTDAAKRAEGSAETVNKAATTRDDAMKILNEVQPSNVKNLQNLSEALATQPNLTPAAKQVCGSTRVQPCTPQQCEGDLCPPDGAPACAQGERCTGALPQSNRSLLDSEEAKAKLQQFGDNITQTFTKIQETQDAANRVRLSTDELTDKIKRARDDMDSDLNQLKDFTVTLRNFLSDPSSDPEAVKRVCDSVLGIKLPESVDALKKKLVEIQDLAAFLPNGSSITDTVGPQLEQARQLLEEAEKARDEALGLQGDVTGIVTSLDKQEGVLADIVEKVEKSLGILEKVQDDVRKTEDALRPAEQFVAEVPGLLDQMRPLLDNLGIEVAKGRLMAEDAQQTAEDAEEEAQITEKELAELQDQLEKLKQRSNDSFATDAVGQRLQALQRNATDLVQETADMINKLADKETSIQKASEELQANSLRLEGLEERLKQILADIRGNATQYAMCQG